MLFSFVGAGGRYVPVPPVMFEIWGDENVAVMISGLIYALVGGSFAGFSIVWDLEYSLLSKTFIYYFVHLVVMFLSGYVCCWFPRDNYSGYISFFIVYTLVFVFIWIICYLKDRRNIMRINSKITDEL